MRGPFIAFEGVLCKHETDKAILCVIADKEVWIPLGQIHDDSEIFAKGGEGKLIVTQWIATEKGLEDFGEEYEE